MRPIQILLAVLSAALVRAESQTTAAIFIQPITSSPETAPSFLAEVTYDASDLSAPIAVTEYEAPDLPEEARLVRIGVYDRTAKAWASSTSVASVDNFGKGYSPHITVTVDGAGGYLGASCRGVGIDAGQTRDFGPQAMAVVTAKGKQPELNKPVVLSPEGKQVVPEEKSFLQKYVCSLVEAPQLLFDNWLTYVFTDTGGCWQLGCSCSRLREEGTRNRRKKTNTIIVTA